jgi:predicted membrane channel-forming protein YqfA (hemolysin III family)
MLMNKFLDKYFFQSTRYLVLVFSIFASIVAILIAIKWNKTLDGFGGYVYLIIAVSAIIFIYNRLSGKKKN